MRETFGKIRKWYVNTNTFYSNICVEDSMKFEGFEGELVRG